MDRQPIEDKKLKQVQTKHIENDAARHELSKRLGCSPIDLLQMLRQKNRVPADIQNKLNEERLRLEARIDEKIKETKPPLKKQNHPDSVKGHWMFIR